MSRLNDVNTQGGDFVARDSVTEGHQVYNTISLLPPIETEEELRKAVKDLQLSLYGSSHLKYPGLIQRTEDLASHQESRTNQIVNEQNRLLVWHVISTGIHLLNFFLLILMYVLLR